MKKLFIMLGIFVGLILAMFVATIADAATYDTGWLDADVFATGGTGVAFTNPSNAISSNNSYAQSIINDTNTVTQFLKATDYDTTIPDSMEITGIEVRFERKRGLSTTGAGISDYQVQIVGCSGTSYSYLGTIWPSADAYQVYGSSTYLWDLDCLPADINATTFGFGVRASFYDNGCISYPCSTRAQVDHMQMKIHYQDPAASVFRRWLMAPFILGAQAATCTFTEQSSTTTVAECDDPIIHNPTQDIAFGILFMLLTGFVTVISLYRKPKRDTK